MNKDIESFATVPDGGAEAVFVGDVIAHEYGPPSPERLALHQAFDRATFIYAARTDFKDHFARQYFKAAFLTRDHHRT